MIDNTTDAMTGVELIEIRGCDVELNSVLAEITTDYPATNAPGFLEVARRLAFQLFPTALIDACCRFRDQETAPVLSITGLAVDDDRIGATPPHWRVREGSTRTAREEIYLVLLGCLLGEPFSWSSLQHGSLITNVLPIQDQEHEQSGHGSTDTLAWHTEDGFHPYRCDYLGLMAMRNDDRIPTTVSWLAPQELDPVIARILCEPRFIIHPDDEHLRQRMREQSADFNGDDGSTWPEPGPTAVLFGDIDDPYLRIDPFFMEPVSGDAEAAWALDTVRNRLEANLRPISLRAGDVAFIDNYRAVHGRKAFHARYDGRDRWLKKVLISRDLRKSRYARASCADRMIDPTRVDAVQLSVAGVST